jgi:heme exporter protein D
VRRVAGPFERLGAYAALAAVVGVLVLGALCLSMRRDLRELRRAQTREGRLRQFLDEAAAAFEDAHITLSEMAVDLLSAARSPDLHESVARSVFAVKVMRRRVGMRFPPEHPVSVAYGGVEQSVDARGSYLNGIVDRLGEGETMTEGEDAYDNELHKESGVAFGNFASAARTR